MRMCFSGCGGVVYISSTVAEGSQIQGQPGLHSKTLYLFLKTFTKQDTCFADLWNCLGSTDRGKQMVLKVFSALKHFLSIYFFFGAVVRMRLRSNAGHSKCVTSGNIAGVLLQPCASVDLAARAFTH